MKIRTKLTPLAYLNSTKAKNTTVSSSLSGNSTNFITGSEDGLICVWSNNEESNGGTAEGNQTSNKLKSMKKLKIGKKTPYDE